MATLTHLADADPTSEGWVIYPPGFVADAGPVTETFGGVTFKAWRTRDLSDKTGYGYVRAITSDEAVRIMHQGWSLSATVRVDRLGEPKDGTMGLFLQLIGRRWSLWFAADTTGITQAYLQEPPFSPASFYPANHNPIPPVPQTQASIDRKYSTFTWIGRSFGMADLYINGWLALPDYPGSFHTDPHLDMYVGFGSGSGAGKGVGYYERVEFTIAPGLPLVGELSL